MNTIRAIKLIVIFLLGLFIGRLTVPSVNTITRTGTTSDFKEGLNKVIKLLEQIEKNTRK